MTEITEKADRTQAILLVNNLLVELYQFICFQNGCMNQASIKRSAEIITAVARKNFRGEEGTPELFGLLHFLTAEETLTNLRTSDRATWQRLFTRFKSNAWIDPNLITKFRQTSPFDEYW